MSKILACMFYPSILCLLGYVYLRLQEKIIPTPCYDPDYMIWVEEQRGYGEGSYSGDNFINAAMFLSQGD